MIFIVNVYNPSCSEGSDYYFQTRAEASIAFTLIRSKLRDEGYKRISTTVQDDEAQDDFVASDGGEYSITLSTQVFGLRDALENLE